MREKGLKKALKCQVKVAKFSTKEEKDKQKGKILKV